MAKFSPITVNVGNTLTALNANFTAIAALLQNKLLWRDNPIGEPNAMVNDIDMNGNDVFNAGLISATEVLVGGDSISDLVDAAAGGYVADAEAAAIDAANSATAAQGFAAASSNSATASANSATASATSAGNSLTSANNSAASAASAAASAASVIGSGVTSVNGFSGAVVLTKSNVGLGSADNTSDLGKPVSTAQAAAIAAGDTAVQNLFPMGNDRLIKNGAVLQLIRYNGNRLFINGVNELIPSTPPQLAATGLTPGTNMFIYAYMNGATMTLEASATTFVISTTTGFPIKTGDATRTLVGFVRVNTGPAFSDTSSRRLVASYRNRLNVSVSLSGTGNNSTVSATAVELNSGLRGEFLNWGEDVIEFHATSNVSVNALNALGQAGVGLDSSSAFAGGTIPIFQGYNAGTNGSIHNTVVTGVALGNHYITFLAQASGGTATFNPFFVQGTIRI